MQYSITPVVRQARRITNIIVVIVLAASFLQAQISDKISKVDVETARPQQPCLFRVELVQSLVPDQLELVYRPFGQQEYKHIEMAITGNSATATLPASAVNEPYVEYYFALHFIGKIVETYPAENPEQQPLRLAVQSVESQIKRIVILSPEPGERLRIDEFLISFSLRSLDSLVAKSATKVFLDGTDVSSGIVNTDELFVVRPENSSVELGGGPHTVRVELYDADGNLLESANWTCTVTGASVSAASTSSSPWVYNSSVQLETRSENISNTVTPYNRATILAGGSYNQFRINGRVYVTNEEQESRQPQNRYFLGAESPWLKVGIGDNYPTFPDLFMSGKRVRGLSANLTLGALNLDFTKGDIVRHIESEVIATFPDTNLNTQRQLDSTAYYGIVDPSTGVWGKFRTGTFNRDIVIIRPSFGPRDGSHLGFTYLKSTDDIHSVRFGVKPEENLVLGSDLLIAIDKHNVELSGQAAISATYKDITNGSFSDADIDRVFGEPNYDESTRDRIRSIRDIVSRVITVNENLVPLAAKNFPTLAYEGALSVNYFGNQFKAGYVRRGESYESFGQSFIRADIKGFHFFDRLRLIQDQVFLSGGYERLTDNTAETKASTTTGTTATVGLSYFPRTDLPNITLGYTLQSNVNAKPLTDPIAIDDNANRIYVQLGKEFTNGIRHNTALSLSTSTRDDRTFRDLDTRGTSVTLSDMLTFNIPLQAQASVSINSNRFDLPDTSGNLSASTLSYTTVYLNGQYRMMEERLRLAASVSPTFGDLQRVAFDGSAQYYFWKNLSGQMQVNFFVNSKLFNSVSAQTDIIWSFILRADV